MSLHGDRIFTSLTHGLSKDCRQANAKLKETLESYNFGAFLMEKTCSRCPNDDCNTSFMLILQQREFLRLKRQVTFEVRPTFLVHKSFSELIEADRKIRKKLLEDNSIGIQVGPEMVNKIVDACPPVCNALSQTDFMVGKKDTGDQTDVLDRRDAESQITPEEPEISLSEVQQSDFSELQQPTNITQDLINEQATDRTISPVYTLEVQQEIDAMDDDDVVFIEVRPRNSNCQPLAEVKLEEPVEETAAPVNEATTPVGEAAAPEIISVPDLAREIKEEVIEEVVENPTVEKVIEQPLEEQEPTSSVPNRVISDSISNTPSYIHKRTLNSSMTSPVSFASNSEAFHTPVSSDTSRNESDLGSSAKRTKYSDVEMCQMCWNVSYFNSLDEYCNHILEMHVSICRFKCIVCDKKIGCLLSANHHTQIHYEQAQAQGDMSAQPVLIAPEITEENLQKFINTAHHCYPDKFRSIPSESIAEIIKNLP